MRMIGRPAVVAALLAGVVLTAPPAVAEDRTTDPVGDGTPDIVALTTIVTADRELVMEWEFAEDYVVAGSFLTVHFAGANDPPAMGCSGYTAAYAVGLPSLESPGAGLAAPDPTSDLGWSEVTPLDYWVSGRTVTIVLPMGLVGWPEPVRFAALVYTGAPADDDADADRFPDWRPGGDVSCHTVFGTRVPTGVRPVPPASGVGVGVLAGAAAIIIAGLVVYWRMRRLTGGAGATRTSAPTTR